MNWTDQDGKKSMAAGLVLWLLLAAHGSSAQNRQPGPPPDEQDHQPLVSGPGTTPHRTRLILKDGSYQLVMSYRIDRDRVVFVSAERGGAQEEVPLALVDLDATHRWEQRHPAAADPDDPAQAQAPAPAIDPELLKEEEARRTLSPEVEPDLRLPEQDSVVALDVFRGGSELVPLTQSAGDLNTTTSHNLLRSVIDPRSSSHQIVQLRGEKAAVQLHVNQPSLYLRTVDDPATPAAGTPLTVDTHGASTAAINNPKPSTGSRYVIVRVDVREDARVVASFQIERDGQVRRQGDVVETTAEPLPGGHWTKLTPRIPLSFGEYALVEVLSPREINLGVWDFGVHPTAPENRDVVKPEAKRPVRLDRREPQ